MKKSIIIKKIAIASLIVLPSIVVAQGTVYFSSMGQTPTSSFGIGSNSWFAMSFMTGGNVSGYALDSIELGMANASGSPAAFAISLYSATRPGSEFYPANSLLTLSGSADPSTNGAYTYTPISNFILSSNTTYFIILTSSTAVANGAYQLNGASPNYNAIGGWHAPVGSSVPDDNYTSINGINWTLTGLTPQFALSATAIPEPAVLGLFVLGGLGFLWQRRKT